MPGALDDLAGAKRGNPKLDAIAGRLLPDELQAVANGEGELGSVVTN